LPIRKAPKQLTLVRNGLGSRLVQSRNVSLATMLITRASSVS